MTITWNIDEARATIRAQMDEANRLDEVIDDLSAETSAALARAEAAEAEVGRLQAALDQWKQCGDAIMLCATGRAAPLSDSDVCGEIARRRTQVATMEVELAMTSNALRVTQDSVLRNIDRADVAEAEVKRLRAQVATMEAQLQEVRTEYRVACEDFNELLEKASERLHTELPTTKTIARPKPC